MALGSAPYSLVQSFLEEKALLAAFDGTVRVKWFPMLKKTKSRTKGKIFCLACLRKATPQNFCLLFYPRVHFLKTKNRPLIMHLLKWLFFHLWKEIKKFSNLVWTSTFHSTNFLYSLSGWLLIGFLLIKWHWGERRSFSFLGRRKWSNLRNLQQQQSSIDRKLVVVVTSMFLSDFLGCCLGSWTFLVYTTFFFLNGSASIAEARKKPV